MGFSVSRVRTTTYQRPTPLTVRPMSHHAPAEVLERLLVDALRDLCASCPRTVHAGQILTDATRGRPLGTKQLTRLLLAARDAGATREMALGVVQALDRFVAVIWPEPTDLTLAETLRADQRYEGRANEAEIDVLANPGCPGAIQRALEAKRLDNLAGNRVERLLARLATSLHLT